MGWGCASVVEYLARRPETLGSKHNTEEEKERETDTD
jgi:hypothetical protein